jgi:hypothetical protein
MMNELAAIIKKRFPDVGDTIRHKLAQDPNFQDISENYNDCICALRHWRESKSPEAEARASEYQTIARELEQEILETVEALVSKLGV